jgi:methionine-rich copper-binding protein CopC
MTQGGLRELFQDVLRAGFMMAIAVTLVLATRVALAHAVLLMSSPAQGASVKGPDVPVTIKFNSRVDGSRSTLLLATPDGGSKPLAIEKQSAPDTVTAKAVGLKAGKYAVRWQVLAVDGHITRGQIPFEVQ